MSAIKTTITDAKDLPDVDGYNDLITEFNDLLAENKRLQDENKQLADDLSEASDTVTALDTKLTKSGITLTEKETILRDATKDNAMMRKDVELKDALAKQAAEHAAEMKKTIDGHHAESKADLQKIISDLRIELAEARVEIARLNSKMLDVHDNAFTSGATKMQQGIIGALVPLSGGKVRSIFHDDIEETPSVTGGSSPKFIESHKSADASTLLSRAAPDEPLWDHLSAKGRAWLISSASKHALQVPDEHSSDDHLISIAAAAGIPTHKARSFLLMK